MQTPFRIVSRTLSLFAVEQHIDLQIRGGREPYARQVTVTTSSLADGSTPAWRRPGCCGLQLAPRRWSAAFIG